MFVTAASANHFLSVKQFIGSLMGAPVIFYDIGLTESQADEIKRMPIEYRLFDWSKVPSWGHISAPSAGSYVWKPVIIHEVLQEPHELLIWCDAGNMITNRVALEKQVQDVHIYTPYASGTNRQWTHNACLEGMGVSESIQKMTIRNAATIGLWVNDPVVKMFVDSWKTLSLKEALIVGSRDNHRHDQSILSCLFYQYGRTCDTEYIGFTTHNDCD